MAEIDWVVVPSIWWENSPLVIQEAFLHGRPVICSDIGGMAEKVEHEVNGLHFRVGDHAALGRPCSAPPSTSGCGSACAPASRRSARSTSMSKAGRPLLA